MRSNEPWPVAFELFSCASGPDGKSITKGVQYSIVVELRTSPKSGTEEWPRDDLLYDSYMPTAMKKDFVLTKDTVISKRRIGR